MRRLTAKIKPAGGFAYIFHIIFSILLPVLVFIMVRLGFIELAAVLILLSKWRMFAVKPRHWPANIRANGVDLILGLSVLSFMANSDNQTVQAIWALLYGIWLVILKPRSGISGVSVQAFLAMVAGLSALFLNWGNTGPIIGLVIGTWVICYSSARHFFSSYDEPLTRYLSHSWGYFSAATVWVLSHWLLFYGYVAQPTLLLGTIGLSLAMIYYLDQTDRLSVLFRRQLVFVMLAAVIIILVFSDWGDKAI